LKHYKEETHMPVVSRNKRSRLLLGASLMVVAALILGGCSGMPEMSELPFVGALFAEPEPPTPTPAPTPTNTPEPTATPKPGETPIPATPTPVPTPQVTIPQGFTPVVDEERGYSLAVARGYTPLDLRSAQFQNMANTFGAGGQLGPLNDFLDSEQGDALGVLQIADISAALFGGLPTVLNVFVLDAPGYTPKTAVDLITGLIEANSAMLGDANVENVSECTVNNMPAVCATATANLANFGFDMELFVKVVGILANDKFYILTQAAPADKRAEKEPVFDQIIGTFRPE
jgi:hypothetical protein